MYKPEAIQLRLTIPIFIGVLLFLSTCSPRDEQNLPTDLPDAATVSQELFSPAPNTITPQVVNFPVVETQTPQIIDTPIVSPSPSLPPICSPLEGITITELTQPDLLKNLFQPPRQGMDDGHHGVDFAYWSRGERKTMLGLPVLSVMTGRISGIIKNREPYGNAIIIETNLDDLSMNYLAKIALPTQAPTVQPSTTLFCPTSIESGVYGPDRSLYLLYAHLNQTPIGSIGEKVTCGQPIGEVGTTGKSVNPHLHFETRIGPSGMTFEAMAHYENDATTEEMRNYCIWRVSGLFQMFDPLVLLQADSLQP